MLKTSCELVAKWRRLLKDERRGAVAVEVEVASVVDAWKKREFIDFF